MRRQDHPENRDTDSAPRPAGPERGVPPPPAPAVAGPGVGTRISDPSGAPPCNTAPDNCIGGRHFRPLRVGVDSLYLSYPGTVAPSWEARLHELKLAARSPEEAESATAQVKIGEHLFEVLGRGEGRFAYVLADNCFRVLVPSIESRNLPLAHVKFSSELLTVQGLLSAEAAAGFIAGTLGNVTEPPKVSRVDLCADVATAYPMDSWKVDAWVTRAHRLDPHYILGQFSGWSIGSGGPLVCRLYDKTRELQRKPREYLQNIWRAAGWDGVLTVWRLEFQFRREVLKELGLSRFGELPAKLSGLWRYATTEWLRLTIPMDADQTRSRWPAHPLWERFAALAWSPLSSTPLKRVRTERLPSDDYLFRNGLGGLTSFMAARHITDVHEGIRAYLQEAERYHNALHHGKTFQRYVREKLHRKGQRYNTRYHRQKQADEDAQRGADAYRRAKDGE